MVLRSVHFTDVVVILTIVFTYAVFGHMASYQHLGTLFGCYLFVILLVFLVKVFNIPRILCFVWVVFLVKLVVGPIPEYRSPVAASFHTILITPPNTTVGNDLKEFVDAVRSDPLELPTNFSTYDKHMAYRKLYLKLLQEKYHTDWLIILEDDAQLVCDLNQMMKYISIYPEYDMVLLDYRSKFQFSKITRFFCAGSVGVAFKVEALTRIVTQIEEKINSFWVFKKPLIDLILCDLQNTYSLPCVIENGRDSVLARATWHKELTSFPYLWFSFSTAMTLYIFAHFKEPNLHRQRSVCWHNLNKTP